MAGDKVNASTDATVTNAIAQRSCLDCILIASPPGYCSKGPLDKPSATDLTPHDLDDAYGEAAARLLQVRDRRSIVRPSWQQDVLRVVDGFRSSLVVHDREAARLRTVRNQAELLGRPAEGITGNDHLVEEFADDVPLQQQAVDDLLASRLPRERERLPRDADGGVGQVDGFVGGGAVQVVEDFFLGIDLNRELRITGQALGRFPFPIGRDPGGLLGDGRQCPTLMHEIVVERERLGGVALDGLQIERRAVVGPGQASRTALDGLRVDVGPDRRRRECDNWFGRLCAGGGWRPKAAQSNEAGGSCQASQSTERSVWGGTRTTHNASLCGETTV